MSGKVSAGGVHPDMGSGGEKKRSQTSNPHHGSRVDPSHVADKKRLTRDKKAARDAGMPAPAERPVDDAIPDMP